MQIRMAYGLAALVAALGLGACNDNGSSITGGNGSGKVSVLLTDAPSDSIAAAVVTITDIYLQGNASDSVSRSNRVYLRQSTKTTVNLLSLRDSMASLVTAASVPVGTYSQLRVVITGAYVAVRNAGGGTSIYATSNNYEGLPAGAQVAGTLQAPSYATSGLKVLLGNGLTVTDTTNTQILMDFDVSQSFVHQAGNSGMWVLSPVVQATNVAQAASLTVNVGLGTGVTLPTGVALTGFTVQLTDAAGNKRTAPLVVTNGVASATFKALLPSSGPYQVALIAPTGFTFAATPTLPITSITLNSGTNTQTITLTSVTAAAS